MNRILALAVPVQRTPSPDPRLSPLDPCLDPLPLLHEEPDVAAEAEEAPDGAWRPALLTQWLAAEGAAPRQHSVRALLQALGFDALVYGRFVRAGERWLPQAFCTTYADRPWLQRYVCASYHRVDPRLAAALPSSLPCLWSVEALRRAADDAAEPALAHIFVDDLAASGARSGAMFGLPGPSGSPGERHLVSLSSAREGIDWLDDARLGQVLTLGFCLHALYTRHLPAPGDAAVEDALPAGLSALQREILDCVARGLGDKQIAARLSLSAHNVDYHLRQLRRRFGARNRVQLTQAALRAGLRYEAS